MRLLLNQVPGEHARPYTNEPYRLYQNGALVQEGSTDDEGALDYAYEPPWKGELEVETPFGRYRYQPADSPEGLAIRLNALGYYATDGQEKDIAEQPGQTQLQYFQGATGQAPDGQWDPSISQKVKPLMP